MKKIFKIFTLLLLLCSLIYVGSCKKPDEGKEEPKEEVKIEKIQIVESTVPESLLISEVDEKIEDIKIKVSKNNGTEEQINLTKNMISLADYALLSVEGTHTIKVKYLEFETNLTLVIKKPVVEDPEKEPIPYTVEVKDIAGKPLADFYVTVYLGDEIVAEKYTNSEGKFEAMLLPNIYDVIIEAREGYFLNQELFETDLIGSPIEYRNLLYQWSLRLI